MAEVKLIGILAGLVMFFGLAANGWSWLSDAECQRVRDQQRAFARKLCESILQSEKAEDANFALASLWLNERTEEGNQRMRNALKLIFGTEDKLTPERLGTDENSARVKWRMRIWLRIYYLFRERIDPDVQEMLREMFWNYGVLKSTLEPDKTSLGQRCAQRRFIRRNTGSENHEIMDLVNAFLALQAVKDLPEYADRKLPDGHTPAEHVAALNDYYKFYFTERAKYGLMAEVFSPTYGKWSITEFVNIADFAEDPEMRRAAEMFLHLTWADWAIGQLGGMRGGGRTRTYKGSYSQNGGSDSWRDMGVILLGKGDWLQANGSGSNQILAMTNYSLPDVIIDLALSEEERGDYVYTSLRPGKTAAPPPEEWSIGGKVVRPGNGVEIAYIGNPVTGSDVGDTAGDLFRDFHRWRNAFVPPGDVYFEVRGLPPGKYDVTLISGDPNQPSVPDYVVLNGKLRTLPGYHDSGLEESSATFPVTIGAGEAISLARPKPSVGSAKLAGMIISPADKDAIRVDFNHVENRENPTEAGYVAVNEMNVIGTWMDGADPRFLRYDYCTPDYVMGSIWVDPGVDYAAVNSQNRWQGFIFPTHIDARVFPSCVGLRNGKTYNEQVAVQHKNVMIVQKNRRAHQTGDMRVWFYSGMKKRLTERNGWILAKEGKAYIAVRPLSDGQSSVWEDENWVHCKDDLAPVVLVAGRESSYSTIEEFFSYVDTHKFSIEDGLLEYSFMDEDGKPASLIMDMENQENLPSVNGQVIDLKPEYVFNGPYLKSRKGSGIVTIQKGERELVLDFNSIK